METNPYGLFNLWAQGDLVTRGVAVLLLIMSMLSWYVMLARFWQSLRQRPHTKRAWQDLRHAHQLNELNVANVPVGDPYAHVASSALDAQHQLQVAQQRGQALECSGWLADALRQATDDVSNRLQSGLGILSSVSSTAPFVGLFGTVWGIYHALISIGMAGQASIDKVAGPVGEALIMTALGLAVAIPATLGYNAVVRSNKAQMARMRRYAQQLHGFALTGVAPYQNSQNTMASASRTAMQGPAQTSLARSA